jgi:hypothetical protein
VPLSTPTAREARRTTAAPGTARAPQAPAGPSPDAADAVRAPRRRAALLALPAAGVTALLAACGGGARKGASTAASASAAAVAAEQRERHAAGRDSLDLLARYDAVLAAHPGTAHRLRPLRAEVARHAAAFGTGASASASAAASASATAHRAASGAPSAAPSVPADRGAAVRALAQAERRLADARAKALLHAPADLARLLASVAASGAAHALLLGEG